MTRITDYQEDDHEDTQVDGAAAPEVSIVERSDRQISPRWDDDKHSSASTRGTERVQRWYCCFTSSGGWFSSPEWPPKGMHHTNVLCEIYRPPLSPTVLIITTYKNVTFCVRFPCMRFELLLGCLKLRFAFSKWRPRLEHFTKSLAKFLFFNILLQKFQDRWTRSWALQNCKQIENPLPNSWDIGF